MVEPALSKYVKRFHVKYSGSGPRGQQESIGGLNRVHPPRELNPDSESLNEVICPSFQIIVSSIQDSVQSNAH